MTSTQKPNPFISPDDLTSADHTAFPRASIGKIARLPDAIRNQLNHRLLNGQSGPEILTWLNNLNHVKKILATQFEGTSVTKQNLSNWRGAGYQRWLHERTHIAEIKGLGIYSKNIVDAGRGSLSCGAATVTAGKILKFLNGVTDEQSTPDNLAKLAIATTALLKAEQGNARVNIARQRLRLKEAHLLLMRDKHQRDVAAIALRVLGDARAIAIEASSSTYAEKHDLMGRYLFDDLWDPRPTQIPPDNTRDAPLDCC